jgi:hypothetical protein
MYAPSRNTRYLCKAIPKPTSRSVALPQQLPYVLIQPIFLQSLPRHLPRPINPPFTPGRTTCTVKWLIHLPFRRWVEERQCVPFLQWTVIHHPNLALVHVKDNGGRARVVAEHQIGIELNVLGARYLHGGVPLRGDRGGPGDAGEESTGGEIHEGECTGAKGFGAAVDLDQSWVCGRGLVFGLCGGCGGCVGLDKVWFGDGRHGD